MSRSWPKVAALALAGLLVAVALGLAAHLITRETLSLSSTRLQADKPLAPPAARGTEGRRSARAARPAPQRNVDRRAPRTGVAPRASTPAARERERRAERERARAREEERERRDEERERREEERRVETRSENSGKGSGGSGSSGSSDDDSGRSGSSGGGGSGRGGDDD